MCGECICAAQTGSQLFYRLKVIKAAPVLEFTAVNGGRYEPAVTLLKSQSASVRLQDTCFCPVLHMGST